MPSNKQHNVDRALLVRVKTNTRAITVVFGPKFIVHTPDLQTRTRNECIVQEFNFSIQDLVYEPVSLS